LDGKVDSDDRDLVKNLQNVDKNVNVKGITGQNVEIKGTFSNSGQSIKAKGVDVTIIASGKDTTITGDLTIKDSNPETTDAYLIAAADDLQLRGKPSSGSVHYNDPDPIDIRVENASLALAAPDDMYLLNVDISTGGSLALASLDDLTIWSTRDDNEFEIGNGKRMEGVFLYADDVLKVSNTEFKGHIDDVYLEATTVMLNHVTFPASSAVLIRSQNGRLNILNSGDAYGVGDVNFNMVKHLGIKSAPLTRGDFDFGGENIGARSKKSASSPVINGANGHNTPRAYIEVQKLGN
jgi:hypothetical protein